jgi:cysteine synthase A
MPRPASAAPFLVPNACELIGNTPLIRLNRIPGRDCAEILAKHEGLNPGGSVKDRICISMVNAAESDGLLKPGNTIVEPTSGNTGIGLALVAGVRGYKCILTMPESMSLERRALLKLFGAQLELTPAAEGMNGAVKRAEQLVAEHKDYFMPQQFKNPANPEVHRKTTAEEIWRDTGGKLDAFVAGVGTGGTITGVGEVLKSRRKNVLIIAVEPARSPLLSQGKAGPHRIQGIGANFIPQVLNRRILDRIITVQDDEAIEMSERVVQDEGILCGWSAGANVFAALKIAKELGPGKRVVCVLPDTGERYLSYMLSKV